MMIIPCPNCGPRAEAEFHFGGPSPLRRPTIGCSDAEWAAYLFRRDNPKGEHAERWRHTYGCGRWFNMLRDVVTHEIRAVYAVTDPKPCVGSGAGNAPAAPTTEA